MKRDIACTNCVVLLVWLASSAHGSDRPWQKILVPPTAQVAQDFQNPPPEYGITMWWFWKGDMSETNIRRDLVEMHSRGIRAVMLWPYYGLTGLEYLSPAWFERVRYAVGQARDLGMRVWLMDEGCYPSGFVGGKVTRERPAQRMQVLVARTTGQSKVEVKPEYRTSPTRYIHAPGFTKDTTYSLFDALDPQATRDFLADIHEHYKKSIGDEFGRTVLGFMGDEPSFPGVPYTAGIYEEFQRRKGYDLRPHLAQLFLKSPTEESRRLRADYWDVWTDLYRDNFFGVQAAWCAREKLEYLVHLCGEEDMPTLLALNGDYFKCVQPVQVPGIDAIWRQIWPDKIADYAKLASSAAHLQGRPLFQRKLRRLWPRFDSGTGQVGPGPSPGSRHQSVPDDVFFVLSGRVPPVFLPSRPESQSPVAALRPSLRLRQPDVVSAFGRRSHGYDRALLSHHQCLVGGFRSGPRRTNPGQAVAGASARFRLYRRG